VMGETTASSFRHEALLYAGADEFVARTLPFIEEGLAASEPILVVVGADKIKRLQVALTGSARRVTFADMAEVGANPARIIPAWCDFLSEHATNRQRVRGIGEPIGADRGPAELVECQLHESLLNLAFADSQGFRLLCPYDTESLPAEVIDEALHSHPCSILDGAAHGSSSYRQVPWEGGPFDQPLPEPQTAAHLDFEGSADLARVRAFAAEHAAAHGLNPSRTADLVLVVHEATANSVTHGGGHGNVRIWGEADRLLCELRDEGTINAPLIGRVRPSGDPEHGRGFWLIQQIADLAQVRSSDRGTTVRIHFTKS
jgi:anti-sigma regulatory factor (Ser/Thr protein kinase)